MKKKDYCILIVNLFKRTKVTNEFIKINGFCLVKDVFGNKKVNTDKISVSIGDMISNLNIKFKRRYGIPFFKGYTLNKYNLTIDVSKVKSSKFDLFDIPISVNYEDSKNIGSIKNTPFYAKRNKKISNVVKCDDDNIAYLKVAKNNCLHLIKCKKFSPVPLIFNFHKSLKREGDNLVIKGFGFYKIIRTKENVDLSKMKLDIKDGEDTFYQTDIKFKYKKGIPFVKGYVFNSYKIVLDINKVMTLDIQNKLVLNYDNKYFGRIIYNVFDLLTGKYRTGKIIENNGHSIYLRQTNANTMYLTIRESNIFDFKQGRRKLYLARFLSYFIYKPKLVLLFEKECDKYEESASVLYEKLIDLGYNNVYYILNKNNPKYSTIEDKYKSNIIDKNSFRHLLYFFKCNRFIGTETLGHAIQLRASNRIITKKMNSSRIIYVFLQHGISYMVSLNADMRSAFTNDKRYKLFKVVVSSELEKRHFVDLAGFTEDKLYVTGMPKFDRCMRYDDADKIVIMPTWRRWEMNQANLDFTKTKYYKMIKLMVSSVPDKYKDKIIVMPHPLMKKVISEANNELSKYMITGDFSYDDVLKTCDVLITDYSSISYDAFYRGAKVIFYWKEKEECMEHYGGDAHLMLNEGNAYGPICYDKNDIRKAFDTCYMKPQKKDYVNKYRKIVEFNDGKNCERTVKELVKDRIIR